jgi:putative membrane protein
MSHRVAILSLVTAALVLAGPAHAHARSYSPLDEYMLQSGIQGDRFEIAGGKLAQSKAVTPAVKALGARLLKDHSQSLADAIKVAKRLGIRVPQTPSPSQEWELQMVSDLTGTGFDAAYAKLEIQDHKQDIDDNKMEAAEGANAGVRHLARTDLPVLRTHLKLSKAALRAVPAS